MKTNRELVDYLIEAQVLETPAVISAFRQVDRADFVRADYIDRAYGDYPLPIGQGQTISQPYTVAFMFELLAPRPGQKVLDVGSGSGWTTALLAALAGSQGKVFGVEIIPELVQFGQNNLKKYRFPWASIIQAKDDLGLPGEAPFDRILVSAAGIDVPGRLIDQLKIGGRLVMPIYGSVWQIDKKSRSEIARREFPGFAFVPLQYPQK